MNPAAVRVNRGLLDFLRRQAEQGERVEWVVGVASAGPRIDSGPSTPMVQREAAWVAHPFALPALAAGVA